MKRFSPYSSRLLASDLSRQPRHVDPGGAKSLLACRSAGEGHTIIIAREVKSAETDDKATSALRYSVLIPLTRYPDTTYLLRVRMTLPVFRRMQPCGRRAEAHILKCAIPPPGWLPRLKSRDDFPCGFQCAHRFIEFDQNTGVEGKRVDAILLTREGKMPLCG